MELKRGIVVRGAIISMRPGEYYSILSPGGDTIHVPDRLILNVSYPNEPTKITSRRPYQFKENGFYSATGLGVMFNTVSGNNRSSVGYELSTVFGYQKNRLLGFGIGSGIDFYQPGGREMVVPIFAEVRGYLLPRNVSLYYSVRGGYGIAVKGRNIDVWGSENGWMFNPALGWRLGGRQGMNFTLDLGLKFQKASFDYRWGSERSTLDLVYRRLDMRIGFLF